RAVELGSGIGLAALVLASLGIDVVATDLPVVIMQVLEKNINTHLELVETLVASMLPRNSRIEPGKIDVKVLDWTADPSTWRWDETRWISPRTNGDLGRTEGNSIGPPFDLVIISDTIYERSLIPSILQTLYQLSILSKRTSPHSKKTLYPLIFLSLERRDGGLVDGALQQAREMGFACEMIRIGKLTKLMKKAGLHTMPTDRGLGLWDGVEIWRLQLKPRKLSKDAEPNIPSAIV
ncbi:hypothetical protein BGX38DRAFT_1094655, partial [Terfezia claveryi]